MTNTQRFLLNDQELNALLSLQHWAYHIEKTVLNDPTWGLNGSTNEFHVVYLNDELSLTQFVQIGIDIQRRISNK